MAEVNQTNRTVVSSTSFQTWRETLVRVLLICVSIFGFIALVAIIFNSTVLINKVIYASVYACLLVVTFVPLPYTVRAGVFLDIIYILGLSGLIKTGVWGEALMFFLAFIVMGGLLFSPRVGIYAIAISMGSITIFGFLILKGFYFPRSQEMPIGSIGDWLTGGASLLLLGIISTVGLHYLQFEFVQAQAKVGKTIKTLQTERTNQENRVAEQTDELEKRNSKLRSTVYFIRQIAEIQEYSALPAKTVDLIAQSFGYYHVNLLLLKDDGKTLLLHASSSDAGRKMVERGYRVIKGDRSLVGQVAERAKLIISARNLNASETGAEGLEMPGSHSEIVLPLISRGKVLGVLDIQSEQITTFNQNEPEILQLLADQVAISLDNARRLSEASGLVSQSDVATSQQTQSSWRENLLNQNLSYQYTPSGIKSIPPDSKPQDLNSLHIPLLLRDQEIGSIALQRKDNTEWSAPDQELVKKVAVQVALALDNIRLMEETRQHAVQEQTVNEISARFSRSLDIDTLLQTAVREFAALPDVSEASVFIKPNQEN